ncbi:sulfatase [Flagellimonas sp. S3867]|uniref:sulfatase n=1 Tax=Flagellimonas sp. S3867 TaxID=2768063 RepID=UPI001CC24170|nr:sulfatase [Flagellimonas sp. S3867]
MRELLELLFTDGKSGDFGPCQSVWRRALFMGSIGLVSLTIINCKAPQLQQKTNILLICVDDLRPEIKSFGANHMITPNMDKLAAQGTSFLKHYVNAPSCGPSRYTLLTGLYGPAQNNALFRRAAKIASDTIQISPSMPEWFRTNGYTTVSVGKVSHHPGGRGGPDWNDSSIVEMPKAWDRHVMPIAEWKHPRGAMHGLAKGEMRKVVGEMNVFQSEAGEDGIYPDGAVTNETLQQLKLLATENEKPFFLAVGLIKPHLPFGAPKRYLDLYDTVDFPPITNPQKPEGKTTWHSSNEFMKYNRWDKDPNQDALFADEVRRHYAACVSYADAQIGKILDELKRTGMDENTIVVLWGDHGWHLGEHVIWGKHSLFEESLLAPLIIHDPRTNMKAVRTKSVVETLDIFPTLCDLTGIDTPNFVQGVSLKGILENQHTIGHPAVAYTPSAKTIRTDTHRLVLHDDGYTELYDHTSSEKETKNLADDNPELVKELKQVLMAKLQ